MLEYFVLAVQPLWQNLPFANVHLTYHLETCLYFLLFIEIIRSSVLLSASNQSSINTTFICFFDHLLLSKDASNIIAKAFLFESSSCLANFSMDKYLHAYFSLCTQCLYVFLYPITLHFPYFLVLT